MKHKRYTIHSIAKPHTLDLYDIKLGKVWARLPLDHAIAGLGIEVLSELLVCFANINPIKRKKQINLQDVDGTFLNYGIEQELIKEGIIS